MGTRYWGGKEDDGKIIPPPTDDESILFQRHLIRDMAVSSKFPHRGPNVWACNDPVTGKSLTRAELFDLHSRILLVITEVEQRAELPPSSPLYHRRTDGG